MDDNLKRNVLLGAVSVAGTLAFLIWGTLYTAHHEGETSYAVSPEAPALPANSSMLSAAASLAHAPRVRSSPLPVDTKDASAAAASARQPAAGKRLVKVSLPQFDGHPAGSGGYSGGGDSSLGSSKAGPNAAGGGTSGDISGRWALSAADAALLMRVAGPLDAASAARLGSNGQQLMNVAGQLMDSPQALHYLLDNPHVAKKFYEQPKVKDSCANAREMAHTLSDEADKTGLRSYIKMLARSVGVPGSTVAMVESKINGVLFSQCPSMGALVNDPTLVSGLMKSTPEFFSVMSNPAFASALAKGK